jgi:hypothetical protein
VHQFPFLNGRGNHKKNDFPFNFPVFVSKIIPCFMPPQAEWFSIDRRRYKRRCKPLHFVEIVGPLLCPLIFSAFCAEQHCSIIAQRAPRPPI